jgi:diguanylate cyclase (GGDEF)-like protein
MHIDEFSSEYRQYTIGQLLHDGRILPPIAIVILCYFIYSDIFIREMPTWAFTRILPFSLFLLYYISSFSKSVKKAPIMLIVIYYSAWFSLTCMSYSISIIAWDTQFIQVSVTALMMVSMIVFLGIRGPIFYIIIIYFIPTLLFLAYIIIFTGDINKLANFANSFTVMIGMTIMYYFNEKLKRKIFIVNKKLEFQALTDPLTKLKNRRYMWDFIRQEVNRHERNRNPFTIIMIDIDKFKLLNDSHGHDCGDLVLIKFAKTILSNLRKQDIAARWGGEEFLIILPETDIMTAKVVAERLRISISKSATVVNDLELFITATFGVSEYNGATNIDQVMKLADKALYMGKEIGRNCVVIPDQFA